MIELIQIPYSPFCLVQKRILEYGGIPHKVINIPNTDRSLVWKLTKQRYYAVPIVRDGRTVLFETADDSQVIAKYLNDKYSLGLFPSQWRGIQRLLWSHIEDVIEGYTFKLNDAHYKDFVPSTERLAFIRHKERKFGRGCLEKWAEQKDELTEALAQKLLPFEEMLFERDFLLDSQPRFLDFDLYGMLANFLYTGHYEIPRQHTCLRDWYKRISTIKLANSTREKLRS